jgi:hypothetical protein
MVNDKQPLRLGLKSGAHRSATSPPAQTGRLQSGMAPDPGRNIVRATRGRPA